MIDEQNIYMILEYAENGNLFYYQNKKVTFPETEAFKFFMQTVEAIRYLQHNDILHRDLKVTLFFMYSLKIYYLMLIITLNFVILAGVLIILPIRRVLFVALMNICLLK
jgi:serine/threonine protein kinase